MQLQLIEKRGSSDTTRLVQSPHASLNPNAWGLFQYRKCYLVTVTLKKTLLVTPHYTALGTTSSKCRIAQSISGIITGINDLPVSVSEYSTLGGTCG